jgi:hypothetical protein
VTAPSADSPLEPIESPATQPIDLDEMRRLLDE